jgi:transcriptional regulator with XRE-family HTH domain
MDGDELLLLLRARGRKQKELAALLGVSEVTVSKYVRGSAKIPAARERRIREWLGSSVGLGVRPIDAELVGLGAGPEAAGATEAAAQAARERLPRVPDAFPEGAGSVPNNPLIVAGLEAMFKGGHRARTLVGGWQATENGWPVCIQENRRGGRLRVYPRLDAGPDRPVPSADSLWAFVAGLSPFTGDVALAVLAQLCEPSTGDKPKAPALESVRVTTDAILGYKGIRRYGQERRDLERRVQEEMRRLQALTIDVEQVPAPDAETCAWNAAGASWEEDGLFDIMRVTHYRQGPGGAREQV